MPAPEVIEIGDVGVIAYGGTHARHGINYATGKLGDFEIEKTPKDKDGFIGWLSEKSLEMYFDGGIHDIFVGFPGPTHDRGSQTEIGPMVNVPFLKDTTMMLEKELRDWDPLMRQALDSGNLNLVAAKDGYMHAAAAAHFHGQKETPEGLVYYDSIGGYIGGTGIGGGVVDKMQGQFYRRTEEDVTRPIYNSRAGLREWGHLQAGAKDDFEDTYESRYSGPALNDNHDFGLSASEAGELPDHPIWEYAGNGYGDLIGDIARTDNPELIVISGGFGSREYRNYGDHLQRRVAKMIASGNINLRMALEATTIQSANPTMADSYELYGAPTLLAARRAAGLAA